MLRLGCRQLKATMLEVEDVRLEVHRRLLNIRPPQPSDEGGAILRLSGAEAEASVIDKDVGSRGQQR
jgi:hypothetical protein